MKAIRFYAVVDQEQVIRPPEDITLPQGAIEVTVQYIEPTATPDVDPLAPTRHWLLALAVEAEQEAPDLPNDMAEYHDHYAHGKWIHTRRLTTSLSDGKRSRDTWQRPPSTV